MSRKRRVIKIVNDNPDSCKEYIESVNGYSDFLKFANKLSRKTFCEWISTNLQTKGKNGEMLIDVLAEIHKKEKLSRLYEKSESRCSRLTEIFAGKYEFEHS